MSVITVCNALYCNEELIIPQLDAKTGYRLVNDSEIVALAGKLSGIAPDGSPGLFRQDLDSQPAYP